MNKRLSVKTVAAGILYICSILFAIYVSSIILMGHGMFSMKGLVVCTLVIFIPDAIATILLISSTTKDSVRHKITKVFILILFVFYCILLASLLFLSGMRQHMAMYAANFRVDFKMNANLIPFKTITAYIHAFVNETINKSSIFENLFGNLFLFAPMGIMLPSMNKRLRVFWRFLLTMLIILFGVELVQLITYCGSFDIDDVILNLTGAVLFYGIWNLKYMQKLMSKIYVI